MAIELTGTNGIALLAARVLFGGLLAFMGLNHFMNADGMAAYAESKGIPGGKAAVLFSGGQLVFGGLLIALGVYPAIGAGAIAVFLLIATPTMHDFWTVEDPEAQQNEMTQFLKNATMLAGALSFLVLAGTSWPYAVGIGL